MHVLKIVREIDTNCKYGVSGAGEVRHKSTHKSHSALVLTNSRVLYYIHVGICHQE